MSNLVQAESLVLGKAQMFKPQPGTSLVSPIRAMGATETEASWSLQSNTFKAPYENFGELDISRQPVTSDASSMSTTTSETAAIRSGDSSSTPHTTPDIDSDELQIFRETKAAEMPIEISDVQTEGESNSNDIVSRSTRRRSTRISMMRVPTTPKTRSVGVKPTCTDTVVSTESPSSTTMTSIAISSSMDSTFKIREPEGDSGRRKSARLSTAHLKITTGVQTSTPKTQGTKRPHSTLEGGCKSAGPKIGSSRETRIKVENSEAPNTLFEEPAPKRRREKAWIDHGLYVGVEQDSESKAVVPIKGKTRGKAAASRKKAPVMPVPVSNIFNIQRDFKMPYFVWAPTPYHIGNVPGWRILNHNVFIGDASTYWKKENASNVKCVCTEECNDHCLNRCTWMECDNESCNVGRNCKNRAFADLRDRIKRKKGKDFARGVDVFLTEDRGYGLRATRSFNPHQIIVEYTGEIVTQEESERRMDEVYKDNQNYYLMLFDQNMILDATRGSVARFVNHSCEPNSRMEKWLVEGKPRMALFAGDQGVKAGDELTYDYNFNWFKGVTQQSCKCGSEKCRGTLGKRTDVPKTKAAPPSAKSGKNRKVNKSNNVVSNSMKKGKGTIKTSNLNSRTAPKVSSILSQKPIRQYRALQPPVPATIEKPKRKLPTRRRPSTPPQDLLVEDSSSPLSTLSSPVEERSEEFLFPIKRESPEFPEITPLLSSSDEEDEEPTLLEHTPKRPTPPPLIQRARTRRIIRTYKVNKTILPPTTKSVASQASLHAVRDLALEQVLSEAAEAEAAREKAEKTATGNGRPVTELPMGMSVENGSVDDHRSEMAVSTLLNGVGGAAAALGKSIYASA